MVTITGSISRPKGTWGCYRRGEEIMHVSWQINDVGAIRVHAGPTSRIAACGYCAATVAYSLPHDTQPSD